MTRILLLIFGILLSTSCKDKIAKFIFDSSKMSELTRYSYEYNSNKLASSKESNFRIMFGQVVDTMITLTNYEYDSKGLLKRESIKTAPDEVPSFKLFDYNANDSLIREVTLSPKKDTVQWTEYKYFPDGKKMVFSRNLFHHYDPSKDFLNQMKDPKFDTIYYRIDYQYENNSCKSSKEYDGKNNLITFVEYENQNGKTHKSTYIARNIGIDVIEKTKYFDYSKSDLFPDYFSIGLTLVSR